MREDLRQAWTALTDDLDGDVQAVRRFFVAYRDLVVPRVDAGGAVGESARRVGTVTSGAPSPTLGHPIALAYVTPELSAEGTELAVDVRGRAEPVVVVPLPFYRRPQQS